MPGIDLYQIYGLDRTHPPEALAAALTDQLNRVDPRDTLTRSRIDTARAILGDPQRRAAYDRQLGDPSAPSVTEEALARISGRPVPTAPRPSLRAQFASKQVRIVSAITAALALVLVVGITAVACSGGGDSGTAASGGDAGNGSTAAAPSSGDAGCEPSNNEYTSRAKWDGSRSTAPSYEVALTRRIALPRSMPWTDRVLGGTDYYRIGDGFRINYRGLAQLQDRSIGVFQGPDPSDASTPTAIVTTVSQDGAIVSTRDYAGADAPLPAGFDLARTTLAGYFRISAADGVSIPAAATGTEQEQAYAEQILPDAFDEHTVWVIMRGEEGAIFKATFQRCTN
ncbi:heat shock protein DnaJ domain protein [Gordonia bronchialis DSM 43247]|uniref:Heat shock protein DnaJ domain protein n=1 Tax=Gordonia bronchialis (strain ATCC 25592 / DSM 43247 / BCRC 13721 / JCM 3198 / KCTC 3076 / NBRC 16047 / NCTC 10667) TaxID=526226 RepID=D0LEF6_GORB4|nr:hypothetical protein [Gordonia bronchialis]ACY19874.1 heat shock protein DnaJ domain protein [Gordonia bronchialis DSM 43247]MCC3322646.1 hypothetical protein [Gordonia bronchialis]QGS26258.1 hypothetical protein FOB84_21115 [Gordonia bronchialis]STQ62651.1 Uncharacterised protein [Gordonia bronchialis]